jgi:hypothetical protein
MGFFSLYQAVHVCWVEMRRSSHNIVARFSASLAMIPKHACEIRIGYQVFEATMGFFGTDS